MKWLIEEARRHQQAKLLQELMRLTNGGECWLHASWHLASSLLISAGTSAGTELFCRCLRSLAWCLRRSDILRVKCFAKAKCSPRGVGRRLNRSIIIDVHAKYTYAHASYAMWLVKDVRRKLHSRAWLTYIHTYIDTLNKIVLPNYMPRAKALCNYYVYSSITVLPPPWNVCC